MSIEAVSGAYQGYWQVRGWENDAHYQTGSEMVDTRRRPGHPEVRYQRLEQRGPRHGPGRRNRLRREQGRLQGGGQHRRGQDLDDCVADRPALELYVGLLVGAVEPACDGKLQARWSERPTAPGRCRPRRSSGPFPNGATGYHVVDISVLPATPPPHSRRREGASGSCASVSTFLGKRAEGSRTADSSVSSRPWSRGFLPGRRPFAP